MIEEYIKPLIAYKKLYVSKILKQPLYIYGATGFGKTELIRQYLKNENYIYVSCIKGFIENNLIMKSVNIMNSTSIIVIDDMHMLSDKENQKKIIEFIHRRDIWVIMICRSKIPAWLTETFMEMSFLIITEEDLRLSEKDVAEYLKQLNIELSNNELEYLCQKSNGNAYVIKNVAMRLMEGYKIDNVLTENISKLFADYLEYSVMEQWDTEVLEFLMEVSVVDSFNESLAEMITGNSNILVIIQKAMETGNFIFQKDNMYYIRPVLLRALRSRAKKVYNSKQILKNVYNAGMYYAMNNMETKALEMFDRCDSVSNIQNILISNARKNPGNGHYFEMRKYYFKLKESDIENNVILMNAMCMLYSLMMNIEKSEYWYDKLKSYQSNERGAKKREALSRLAYLDIALPHRGNIGVLETIKKVPSLLFDKGIKLPEFSVTSNMPSTMNGGKDFCSWSKKDRELAKTFGKLVEKVLGSYGKGLVNVALGESLYEKGGDTYEVLSMLSKAQLETEAGGKIEIAFASIGLQIRMYLSDGSSETAKKLLSSFESKVNSENALQLLPNIYALRCRIALYTSDRKIISKWLIDAPDENAEFYILNRYQYLTKIRCYIANGSHKMAYSLIEKLRYYAEMYKRQYIKMELGLLTAIVKNRLGVQWQDELIDTITEICEYRFIRIISEEGAALNNLLNIIKKRCLENKKIDNAWFTDVLEETAKMARRYPGYLRKQMVEIPDFSETAINILRMQADGLSIPQIAEKLNMNARTVKYHTQENYKKLGVSGKSEAILLARNLGML